MKDFPIVPAEITLDFIRENSKEPYGQNIRFELSKGIGHTVPKEIIGKVTKHFNENL